MSLSGSPVITSQQKVSNGIHSQTNRSLLSHSLLSQHCFKLKFELFIFNLVYQNFFYMKANRDKIKLKASDHGDKM